jgi:hypothetical protein
MKSAPDILTLAGVIFVGAALLLGAIDLAAALHWGQEGTISWQLLQLARRHPIVAFLLGFGGGILIGHLFWPQPD